MRRKKYLFICLLVLVGLSGYLCLENISKKNQLRSKETGGRIFPFDLQEISSIHFNYLYIQQKKIRNVTLEKRSDQWIVANTMKMVVDHKKLIQMLNYILGYKYQKSFKNRENSLKEYGLDESSFELCIKLFGEQDLTDENSWCLKLGRKSSFKYQVYFSLSRHPHTVFLGSQHLNLIIGRRFIEVPILKSSTE